MYKNLYFDAAASALKPESVINAEFDFLRNDYANFGRGICSRAVAVDSMVTKSRICVAKFINANPEQVVFTSGATDGLNRIINIITSQSWYSAESIVAVSDLDHHSARLPWEMLKQREKVGDIQICELNKNLDIKVDSIPVADILVITAMSNVLGRPQDVKRIIATAREKNPNIITIVDASQYVVHNEIDVKKWGCDFLVFSGHKIGADTGVGVLYIRDTEKYFPDKFGGGMVARIGDENGLVLSGVPDKWEAGTLPLTQIVGLVPAINYLESNRPNLDLIKFAFEELSKNPKIKIITDRDATVLSFIVQDMHPLDFGVLVGTKGLCLRVGNMCASWIHKKLGLVGTVRLSVGAWNTIDEMKQAIDIITSVIK